MNVNFGNKSFHREGERTSSMDSGGGRHGKRNLVYDDGLSLLALVLRHVQGSLSTAGRTRDLMRSPSAPTTQAVALPKRLQPQAHWLPCAPHPAITKLSIDPTKQAGRAQWKRFSGDPVLSTSHPNLLHVIGVRSTITCASGHL